MSNSMKSKVDGANAGAKRAYATPALTVFGSVRNLTGGASITGMADSMTGAMA